jgi:ATP-binding protein involved in chromosome partitioning
MALSTRFFNHQCTYSLKGTDWGELDVLVLDMPPGTGDVQLAVLQELQLTGAVAVTTPSKLAAVDTRKGVQMFTSLGVPTLAVVENMSYFEVRSCASVLVTA